MTDKYLCISLSISDNQNKAQKKLNEISRLGGRIVAAGFVPMGHHILVEFVDDGNNPFLEECKKVGVKTGMLSWQRPAYPDPSEYLD